MKERNESRSSEEDLALANLDSTIGPVLSIFYSFELITVKVIGTPVGEPCVFAVSVFIAGVHHSVSLRRALRAIEWRGTSHAS